MATDEQMPKDLEAGKGQSVADVVWVAVCFALCGGVVGYLFAPYLVSQLKSSEAALIGVGTVVAAACAVVGVLIEIAIRRKET